MQPGKDISVTTNISSINRILGLHCQNFDTKKRLSKLGRGIEDFSFFFHFFLKFNPPTAPSTPVITRTIPDSLVKSVWSKVLRVVPPAYVFISCSQILCAGRLMVVQCS